MEIRILLDTNILLDYILTREPFYDNAKKIILACINGTVKACIAAHSISNMFFILRREYESKERRKLLLNICKIFDIEGIDKEKLISGLENDDFFDFEDCLQMECARAYEAKYIVTRNVSDYDNSVIQAILPEDFLKILES
ncbi:MAG: PIN domain-containing protein [Lachnospiraceae bacterium]|jgi:Predicted nucleic acid-binding protein, contains PIN domain|nr:PIN domain-containing protein [Lachnospiraceae bacterium]